MGGYGHVTTHSFLGTFVVTSMVIKGYQSPRTQPFWILVALDLPPAERLVS